MRTLFFFILLVAVATRPAEAGACGTGESHEWYWTDYRCCITAPSRVDFEVSILTKDTIDVSWEISCLVHLHKVS